MNILQVTSGSLLAVLAFACGGSVDDSKKISELTDDEAATLCEEEGATDSADCGNGITVEAKSVEKCTSDAKASTSECTVGQIRACNDSVAGDPCKILSSQACLDLVACSGGGG